MARAHIIGRAGSTIRALQEKTGARIQVPKADDTPLEDDDDAMIDVVVEGNALSAAQARNEIQKLAGERSANVQTRLRGIPAEFYPFIAGPRNSKANEMEEQHGVQIRIPAHQPFCTHGMPKVPVAGQRPVFDATTVEDHIQVVGDRVAVQKVKAEIERLAEELRDQLGMQGFEIAQSRHKFIIGKQGVPAESFFDETGCAILLPTDETDELLVIGPADQVQVGQDKAAELAMGMVLYNIDVRKYHRNAAGGAAPHARNVTRYLRKRQEIARLEKLYQTSINTPFSQDGAQPWELFSRDGTEAIRAQSEISGIFSGHPPNRMSSISVDPFFHQHIRNEVSPRTQELFGVQTVVPEAAEGDIGVLLVFEGPESSTSTYQVPRTAPSQDETQLFQKALNEAEKHIMELINKQEQITSESIDVPQK